MQSGGQDSQAFHAWHQVRHLQRLQKHLQRKQAAMSREENLENGSTSGFKENSPGPPPPPGSLSFYKISQGRRLIVYATLYYDEANIGAWKYMHPAVTCYLFVHWGLIL